MAGNFGANNPIARFLTALPDSASLGSRKAFQSTLNKGATISTPHLPQMTINLSGTGRQLSGFRKG